MANDSSSLSAGDGLLEAAPTADPREARLVEALKHVRQALASLRFGQIVVTVQDGLVVQIDRTEKTRLR